MFTRRSESEAVASLRDAKAEAINGVSGSIKTHPVESGRGFLSAFALLEGKKETEGGGGSQEGRKAVAA